MKAWEISDSKNDDKSPKLVFAETINDAKKQAYEEPNKIYNSYSLDPDSWIDIRATRAKYADNMESEDEITIMIRLIENGWWFEIGNERWDENNVDKLKEQFARKVGQMNLS